MVDFLLATLFDVSQSADDRALAARYAPKLRFDVREPFLPLAVGYTIFRERAQSPSFRQGRVIDLTPEGSPPAICAIEYAIWWDWDIGHLYELEHIWVYVGVDEHVVRVEASWHGDHHDMSHEGHLALDGDHPVIFSEPGKHAFAPTIAWFKERRENFSRSETRDLAGAGGLLLAEYIKDHVEATPLKTRLVHTYLSQHAFEPSWDFSMMFAIIPAMLVPWPALRDWMPHRVNAVLDELLHDISPSEYRFLRVGHRGASAHAPDNTLLGIRTAAALGADMVEVDVQRAADGHIVLSHDAHLTDGDGRAWPVHRHTLDELRQIDLGQGERIPTFAEALKVCIDANLGVYIELKDGGAIDGVIATLREEKYGGHCILGSFRPDWLATVKAVEPKLMTSILFNAPSVDAVTLAQSISANFVHPCWERFPNPHTLLTPDWVGRVREAGLGIVCWHEERPEEIAALRAVGVDAICSDKPELLRDV